MLFTSCSLCSKQGAEEGTGEFSLLPQFLAPSILHSLSVDATIMVSNKRPVIVEQVMVVA